MAKRQNIIGKKFGRLTVLEEAEKKNKHRQYVCECDCGEKIIVDGRSLTRTRKPTISCGCYAKEVASKTLKTSQTKHGFANERLYHVWKGMKSRCSNKNNNAYKHYAARGINVCSQWSDDYSAFRYWAFENGYDENALEWKCTIDRINNDGNYEPENCRFVSMKTQSRNRRNNHYVEYKEQVMSLADFCEKHRLNYSRTKSRLRIGWTAEQCVASLS